MAYERQQGTEGDRHEPTQVFGLTKAQLWPIVEDLAGDSVAGFEVGLEHQLRGHYGYSARKVIATVRYTTHSGRAGRRIVFVKWFREPGRREAHHYEHLSGLGAPIPRMYGARTDAEGREMIFLELLEPTGDTHPFDRFVRDAELFGRFLALAARFSALRPPQEYAAGLRRFDPEQIYRRMRAAVDILDEIRQHGRAGDLGDDMARFCRAQADRLPALRALPGKLRERMEPMGLRLSHGDFYPDSVAVRQQTGEMLMVDLEGVGYFPRFWDVARWLGPPIGVGAPDAPREELAASYLAEYARWGGEGVDIDRFLRDVHVLAAASGLMMLPFSLDRALDGRVDCTDDRDEGRRLYRTQLRRELSGLLRATHVEAPP